MYYVKSKKESQAHKKEDNEGTKDLQDQDKRQVKGSEEQDQASR